MSGDNGDLDRRIELLEQRVSDDNPQLAALREQRDNPVAAKRRADLRDYAEKAAGYEDKTDKHKAIESKIRQLSPPLPENHDRLHELRKELSHEAEFKQPAGDDAPTVQRPAHQRYR